MITPALSIEALLIECRRRDIQLAVDGAGGLKINFPEDALTQELMDCLRHRKTELIEAMALGTPPVAGPCRSCGCPGVWTDHDGRWHCAGCERWSDPCAVCDYFIEFDGVWLLERQPAIAEVERLFTNRPWRGRRLVGNGFPSRPVPDVPDAIRFCPGRGTNWTVRHAAACRRLADNVTDTRPQNSQKSVATPGMGNSENIESAFR